MSSNPDFYPTPRPLINKMINKIDTQRNVRSILEPSAGSGKILDVLKDSKYYPRDRFFAIEIDPELRATLIGKGYNVIDSDFLAYEGIDKFDLILANFPFSDGEHHLMKALDIMYSGQIICLVNAETIKNPCTKTRKELLNRLEKLGASIEYLKDEFNKKYCERKTDVEVALISINILQKAEDLFSKGLTEDKERCEERIESSKDVANGEPIGAVVERYRNDKKILTEQILNFYRNHELTEKYMSLHISGDRNYDYCETLTELMQEKINCVSQKLKENYWKETLTLHEVKSRLTAEKKNQILTEIDNYSKMEFSERNLREFILKIVQNYPAMINSAITDLFDLMTSYALKNSSWGREYEKNIHYFNAWKTNHGFKVNQKIILPFYTEYSGGIPIVANNNKSKEFLDDLEKVMCYFTGVRASGKLTEKCQESLRKGIWKNIDTEYFVVSFYQKRTVHVKFKDEQLLRRFNIEACKLKGWLPMDYSSKKEEDLDASDVDMINKFEGMKNYQQCDARLHNKLADIGIKLIGSSDD